MRSSASYLEINFDLWSTTVFCHLKILVKGIACVRHWSGAESDIDDGGLTSKHSGLLYAINREVRIECKGLSIDSIHTFGFVSAFAVCSFHTIFFCSCSCLFPWNCVHCYNLL